MSFDANSDVYRGIRGTQPNEYNTQQLNELSNFINRSDWLKRHLLLLQGRGGFIEFNASVAYADYNPATGNIRLNPDIFSSVNQQNKSLGELLGTIAHET